MCFMSRDKAASVVKANKCERGQISEFVVGAEQISFLLILNCKQKSKLGNKLTNVCKQYFIGLWSGKKQVLFLFFTIENYLILKKEIVLDCGLIGSHV